MGSIIGTLLSQRFTQYLASSNTNFQLSNFLDKSGVHGESKARSHNEILPIQSSLNVHTSSVRHAFSSSSARLHSALIQAALIDPYARAVAKNSLEQLKTLGSSKV